MTFDRAQLSAALGGNLALVAQFEDLDQKVDDTSIATGEAVAATQAAAEASYVTLSPNTALGNEYLLTGGTGISIRVQDGKAIIDSSVRSQGGRVLFQAQVANVTLLLPKGGVLVSEDEQQPLSNKTLDALRVASPATSASGTADRKIPIVVNGVTMYLLASST